MRPLQFDPSRAYPQTRPTTGKPAKNSAPPGDRVDIGIFPAHPKQHAKAVDSLSRQVFGTGLDLNKALRQSGQMALVAVNNATGSVVGAVLLECGRCLDKEETLGIWSLMVSPDAKRQGIGRQLMESALAEGQDRGYPSSTLVVSKDNKPARTLYESLGYQIVGVPDSAAAKDQGIDLPANPRVMVQGKPIPSARHEVTVGKARKKGKKASRRR